MVDKDMSEINALNEVFPERGSSLGTMYQEGIFNRNI